MVKLDVDMLRYLEKEDLRVLSAVEQGMKNHQLVPGSLVTSISGLKGGGISKILHNLTRDKLLVYERGKNYDGYRLTFHGYDYLALDVLSRRGVVTSFGNQIGVGKESDVYIAANEEGERFAVKLHRLGRTSFRRVHDKRDYHHGKVHNWIYMSRLSATREYSFLEALHERGLPVPKPIDRNRHCIVMELINGTLFNDVAELEDAATLYDNLMNLLLSLANDYGLVHGDFNEFNIMIHKETLKPILFDFPQMISTNHKMAKEYFERDVACVVNFFKRKFHFECEDIPNFDQDVVIDGKEGDIISRFPTEATEFEPVIDKTLKDDTNDLQTDTSAEEKSEKDISCDQHVTPSEIVKFIDENNQIVSSECKTNAESDNDSLKNSEITSIAGSRAGTYSVAGSTFTSEEIRSKLKKEFTNRSRREELKKAYKSVKGEDSAVRRQRRDNNARIKDDKAFGNQDWFVA